MIPNDPDVLYQEFKRLIETMPNLASKQPTSDEQLWVGRVHALVKIIGGSAEEAEFNLAQNWRTMGEYSRYSESVRAIIYRVFALLELQASPTRKGSFIPIASPYDAFKAISDVLKSASSDVLIIDPYMDDTIISDFVIAISERINVRLLADAKDYKPALEPAAIRWTQQHGSTRPLSVRLAPPKSLHDRLIILDKVNVWDVSQSFKDLAKRSPASVGKIGDTAQLKIDFYEATWATSTSLT